MKAITTKYYGPTNTRGSRITATDGDGHRCTVPYDYALSVGSEMHSRAAIKLARQMGWTGDLVSGATRDGYVFVFADAPRYAI